MKIIRLELNYILNEEPQLFNNTQTKTRKVYMWTDKRAIFEEAGDYLCFKRESEILEPPEQGFMELWSSLQEMPPPDIDDSWVEEYKSIEDLSKVSLEWHPHPNALRIFWNQQAQSYRNGLVKAPVLELLKSLSLELPTLVKLQY